MSFNEHELVRLVHDPMRIGQFRGTELTGSTRYAIVGTSRGHVRWRLDQIERVPPVPESPVELLAAGRLSEPKRFREVITHVRLTGNLSDMVYSMEATDTDFYPHQFKPVLKMLASPTGRLLIADEVGLGKTIEAGLIWTELEARLGLRRLVVVCPKILCTKWQDELRRRFGVSALICGPAELAKALQEARDSSQRTALICSLQSVRPPADWEDSEPSSGKATVRLARFLQASSDAEPLIDMLVVDEAHHIRNPDTRSHECVSLLNDVSVHALFLSATPIHLHNRDLNTVLRLVDPATYSNEYALGDLIDANAPLLRARDAVLSGSSVARIRSVLLNATRHDLLRENEGLKELLRQLQRARTLSRATRAQWAMDIEQANLLANAITRTRRRDVQEFAVIRDVVSYRPEMSQDEKAAYESLSDVIRKYAATTDMPQGFLLATPQRMLASSLPAAIEHWRRRGSLSEAFDDDYDAALEDVDAADIGPLISRLAPAASAVASDEALQRQDTKYRRLRQILQRLFEETPGDKVIVFSSFRSTLHYLQRRLLADGIAVALIDGRVGNRDDVIKGFKEDTKCSLLLSSEVGSEGIDLQFCRALVNYDLPWNPMRVEQRIGRIDRMGQVAEKVLVINMVQKDTIDDHVYSRLYERLRLCERALGSFGEVLGREVLLLSRDIYSARLTERQVQERVEQAAQACANLLAHEQQLEDESGALVALGDRITQEIAAAKEQKRYVSPEDLSSYVSDALSELFPGSRVSKRPDSRAYDMVLSSSCRTKFQQWTQSKSFPGGGRLVYETGSIVCVFGRRNGHVPVSAEVISQRHPFVRFLAACIEESRTSDLRPAVATQLSTRALRGGQMLRPGVYAVLAEQWRWTGARESHKIAYAGIALASQELIEDEAAEALAMAAAMPGAQSIVGQASLDPLHAAESLRTIVRQHLNERFDRERGMLEARQADRAHVQLSTLDKVLARDRARYRERIERADAKSASATDAATRRKQELVAQMARGRLDKLEAAYKARRAEIVARPAQVAESREFLALLVRVTE